MYRNCNMQSGRNHPELAPNRLEKRQRCALRVQMTDLAPAERTVPLAGAHVAQARDVEYGKTYYLYECARLRAGGSVLKFYHSN
jgi:hypothetical protein